VKQTTARIGDIPSTPARPVGRQAGDRCRCHVLIVLRLMSLAITRDVLHALAFVAFVA
jgi:hypothetical protein